jgi:hypothetical protein
MQVMVRFFFPKPPRGRVARADTSGGDAKPRPYLEDLRVGQRFTSGTHALDEGRGRGLPPAGGVIGAGGEIGWPKPTRPGDVLRVASEVIEIRPSRSRPDRGTAIVRSDTRNQQGEIVQTLIARLVVPRRSARVRP